MVKILTRSKQRLPGEKSGVCLIRPPYMDVIALYITQVAGGSLLHRRPVCKKGASVSDAPGANQIMPLCVGI